MTPRQRELLRIRAEYDRVARMSDEEYADACKRANTSREVCADLMRRQAELNQKEREYEANKKWWQRTPWD